MAWAPEEQAVVGVRQGPRAWWRIDTWQVAALYISRGITSGGSRVAFLA